MLFNSFGFIFIFLPITLALYLFLNLKISKAYSLVFLALSSLFFYSWWNPSYLPIIIGSIAFNYFIKNVMLRHYGVLKKYCLIIGITGNLGLLAYFKYGDFFIKNYNTVFDEDISLLNLGLPLAISFFTFQQIAYLVDSYKCKRNSDNFIDYTLFVSFFPQLISGPIVHHKEMMPQFRKLDVFSINYKNIAEGLFIFSIGLFKKVVLADTFAVWSNAGFQNSGSLNLIEAWVTSLSFSFQIYFDFSGYTDMALGSALLFNIRLPINFNSPYKAKSVREFWQRWHITLSRFLKEYVYIPLGGNRAREFIVITNLLIVFFLGGLWHGAGWTFITWGLLHGVGVLSERFWKKLNIKLPPIIAWVLTFIFINVTMVVFRAQNSDEALSVILSMAGYNPIPIHRGLNDWLLQVNGSAWTLVWIFFGFVITLGFSNSNQIVKCFNVSISTVLWSGAAFVTAILSLNKVSEFLYFNF